jgi:SAM-dependent methyltransferase
MTKGEELPTGEDDVQRAPSEASLGAPGATVPGKPDDATNAPADAAARAGAEQPGADTGRSSSWDHVAEWYDQLVGERGSDHHERVILPGTLRLLGDVRGRRILDVACGQGILCRRLAALGASVSGTDASPRLIALAKRQEGERPIDYFVGDARRLGDAVPGTFDAVTCIMALMNIDPLGPVMEGIASKLAPSGMFVAVMLHPAFRAPGQTSWGWEENKAAEGAWRGSSAERDRPDRGRRKPGQSKPREVSDVRQYRRVDGYLSPGEREIVMNPGRVASGAKAITTLTYHRPIQSYVSALASAGLLVEALEEWPSLRTSQPGPRAAEENRIRREIPMFLAIRAVKR